MRKRRVISRSKTYGFNPYEDQIDTINQIMRETGEKTESVLLRKLVDEALAARREKNESLPLIAESNDEFGDRLEAIEGLLIQLVRQGDTSFRILDVLLALLQDVLAETHAGRRLSWDSLVAPELRRKGVDANDLESRFMEQGERAKNFAYRLAQQIRQSQESTE